MLHLGIPGIEIAMTTNGSLLWGISPNPSLVAGPRPRNRFARFDSRDDTVFRAMNDVNFPVARVVEGIDAAAAAGLNPIKIDAVVKRGVNDHTQSSTSLFASFAERGHILRYIEYMDVGNSNGWRVDDVVPGADVIDTLI